MNNAQEPVLHHFSTVFHVQAFANLDRYCQQEIISDIATQIGTNPKTRDIGLKTMVIKQFSTQRTLSILENYGQLARGRRYKDGFFYNFDLKNQDKIEKIVVN